MPPLVLGTAGHVDHGKTSLVRALTGVDTDRLDRLKEEQERGITIELGFAQLQLAGGVQAALVDVPGHERFVRTMVAGAAGLDAVLLVVAADEGVMPQTREHLEICSLLGLRAGLVALTKVDLLTQDPELRTLAEQELREALRGTFLAAAPIIPCSVRTGVGLDRLREELARLLSTLPARATEGLPRLPIDRVFALRGFGTVVTGTLWSGRLRSGDELSALPGLRAGSERMKVRGLHVHGQPVAEAVAGQRVAVNLAVARELLERGQTLIAPGSLPTSSVCEVELQWLPSAHGPLGRRSQLLLHLGTTARLCSLTLLSTDELAPGGRGMAQLRVPRDQPLLLVPGDRFVLRGFGSGEGHSSTVGGGLILHVGERRRVGRTLRIPEQRAARLAELSARLLALRTLAAATALSEQLPACAELIRRSLSEAGGQGASLAELRQQVPAPLPLLQAALHELQTAGELYGGSVTSGSDSGPEAQAEVVYVSAAVRQQLMDLALGSLRELHAQKPGEDGLSPATLRSQLKRRVRGLRPAVLEQALQALVRCGELISEGSSVRLAGHRAQRDRGQADLAAQLRSLYQQAGLAPPSRDELPALLQARAGGPLLAAGMVSQAVERLCRDGELVRIKDLFFHRAALDELRARLVAHLQAQREIAPPAWKAMVGQSRKFAIPLAEYFDAEKVTLRVGDLRRLRTPPRVE